MTEKTKFPPIHLGSPGEDISKKDLHAISKRFKNLNQLRQQRVQQFLQPRQQIFLHLLSLLFHQNHPLLPGFISSETPAGIADFKPSHQAIQAARQFSKGFTFKRRALLRYPIQGIFLMGSIGSIAFSKTSDMDIWLCHQSNLLASEIEELKQKATEIEKWAASYNLEVHFFLIDCEQFVKGQNNPISIESSGDTQHYLLLEEFYRTAIFIAGRIPAWWLVPPHQEQNYSNYINHLIENRFISDHEILDFGGLESIPAEEFISATLWNIYKSLTSPYKSLLKLFLMESYASEFPQPEWLCFELKNAIYQGTFDIDQLDPYLLIYSKVENYLQKTESTQRLNLARQCFYLKIMGSSSKSLDVKSRLFREKYMQSIATQWDWPKEQLPSLQKQKNWDIRKATQEHNIVRAELKYCLRMIMGLASDYVDYNYRKNKDLQLISRKLHVFLEKRSEKIEIITTRSTVHAKDNEISIVESNSKNNPSVWTLYSGQFENEKSASKYKIKQDHSLLGLLGWLVINGLYQKQLRLHFISSSLTISTSELHQILNELFLLLSESLKIESSTLDVYNKPDYLRSTLLFINLGQKLINERDDGMMILSERSDPLSYGNKRLCFIQRIDQISVSIWGEVTISQLVDADGFFNCLTHFLNNCKHPVSAQSLKIICFTPTRAKSIVLRAETVFANLVKMFSNQSETQNNRYFLPAEHSTYVFQRKSEQLYFWPMDSNEQILQELASNQELFSNVYFDSESIKDTLIPFVYKLNQAQVVQVFYFSTNNNIRIFIVDEKGALFTDEHQKSNLKQVLDNYSVFLESILNHSLNLNDLQILFYEITKTSTEAYAAKLTKWVSSPGYSDLSIRITVEDSNLKRPETTYHVYCNDIEFNSITYGDQLFRKISNYIKDFRNSKDDYPVHITDIEVPCSHLGIENNAQKQTNNYLMYKKKIEAKLNV